MLFSDRHHNVSIIDLEPNHQVTASLSHLSAHQSDTILAERFVVGTYITGSKIIISHLCPDADFVAYANGRLHAITSRSIDCET